MRLQEGMEFGPHIDARPAGVVEAGLVPSGHLLARVVSLAHQDVGGHDGAGGSPPIGACGNHLGRAVGVFDDKLAEKARFAPVMIALMAPADVAAVPAVRKRRPERIVPRTHKLGHIIRAVIHTLVVISPTRIKIGGVHIAPVQTHAVPTQRAGVERGAADRFFDLEFLAQIHRRRHVDGSGLVGSGLFNLGSPHRPVGCGAPVRGPALCVPHTRLPIAAEAGGERFAFVDNGDSVAADHLAAVPQVGPTFREPLWGAGHENLISGLPLTPFLGLKQPAQTGPGYADAQRVHAALAAQVVRAERARRLRRRRSGQETACQEGRGPDREEASAREPAWKS